MTPPKAPANAPNGQHDRPDSTAEDRRVRQAAALRDNLLRRKAQTRARRDRETEPTSSD